MTRKATSVAGSAEAAVDWRIPMRSKSVTAPFICDKAKAFCGDLSEVP